MLKRTLLSLLLAGVLSPLPAVYAEVSLFSKTEIGDCSPQIDGQVDSLTINCHNSTIPEAALKSLESSLKEMVVKRMEQMRTPEEVEKLRRIYVKKLRVGKSAIMSWKQVFKRV